MISKKKFKALLWLIKKNSITNIIFFLKFGNTMTDTKKISGKITEANKNAKRIRFVMSCICFKVA